MVMPPQSVQFAADAEPLAVGHAELNLWEMSAYHTDPFALEITWVIRMALCTKARLTQS